MAEVRIKCYGGRKRVPIPHPTRRVVKPSPFPEEVRFIFQEEGLGTVANLYIELAMHSPSSQHLSYIGPFNQLPEAGTLFHRWGN